MIRLLITIVPKGKANQVSQVITAGVIHFQTVVKGVGTAPSEILDLLCLGDSDKEVILSVVDEADLKIIYDALEETFAFRKSAFGVAFTIDIQSIGKLGYNHLYEDLMGEM